MLNDYFITRDASNYLLRFIETKKIKLPEYEEKLRDSLGKAQLSYERWWELLDELNEALKLPAMGVQIGQTIKVEHCGVLGYLFRSSNNVLQALSCYRRYERLLYAGSTVAAEIKDNQLRLSWPTENGLSSQLSDSLLLAALVSIIREILNAENISPISISFAHSIPETDLPVYNAYFCCPISVGAERLQISFSLDDLNRSIPFQDENLHRLLGQQAEELIKQLPEPDAFLTELRNAIAHNLHDGGHEASTVANALHMSSRTLHRQLHKRGKLYRSVLQDVRKSMARHYLSDPNLSIAEVTLLLGYSEQSAFNRAHMAWFNSTPKAHRKLLLAS